MPPRPAAASGIAPRRPTMTVLVTPIAISARLAAASGVASASVAFNSSPTQDRQPARLIGFIRLSLSSVKEPPPNRIKTPKKGKAPTGLGGAPMRRVLLGINARAYPQAPQHSRAEAQRVSSAIGMRNSCALNKPPAG